MEKIKMNSEEIDQVVKFIDNKMSTDEHKQFNNRLEVEHEEYGLKWKVLFIEELMRATKTYSKIKLKENLQTIERKIVLEEKGKVSLVKGIVISMNRKWKLTILVLIIVVLYALFFIWKKSHREKGAINENNTYIHGNDYEEERILVMTLPVITIVDSKPGEVKQDESKTMPVVYIKMDLDMTRNTELEYGFKEDTLILRYSSEKPEIKIYKFAVATQSFIDIDKNGVVVRNDKPGLNGMYIKIKDSFFRIQAFKSQITIITILKE
jgi:hypothetical protein